jgi:hypothetical protein
MIFKRTLPLVIVFVLGLLAFVQDYVPHPWSGKLVDEITTWFKIIGGFAMFLGVYSLLHMHVARIGRKMPGWGYSMFVFIGAAFMIAAGIYSEVQGSSQSAGPSTQLDWFDWGYEYIQVPAGATIFSILAFFMASAAFRTFRARNLAAGLLLISAVIVMLGRVPVSETISRWLFFGHSQVLAHATDIIMEYPNMVAKRGILLGIALGTISQSIRILLGVERSYMGGD